MVEVRSYPNAEFPPLLDCQVRDFVRIVWADAKVDVPGAPHDPRFDHAVHFVVVDGDLLISHAQVIDVIVEHEGETYRVGGLSGVLTYPNFRGQGYASQVVAAANSYMSTSGADFGQLFTSLDLKEFYNRHNWVNIQTATILHGDKAHPDEHERTMIYPVTARGHAAVKAFENARVYVGQGLW